jgi:hypothetical protein
MIQMFVTVHDYCCVFVGRPLWRESDLSIVSQSLNFYVINQYIYKYLHFRPWVNYLCSQLIVSLLYTNHTTCFGYMSILRCNTHIYIYIYIYINAKIIIIT